MEFFNSTAPDGKNGVFVNDVWEIYHGMYGLSISFFGGFGKTYKDEKSKLPNAVCYADTNTSVWSSDSRYLAYFTTDNDNPSIVIADLDEYSYTRHPIKCPFIGIIWKKNCFIVSNSSTEQKIYPPAVSAEPLAEPYSGDRKSSDKEIQDIEEYITSHSGKTSSNNSSRGSSRSSSSHPSYIKKAFDWWMSLTDHFNEMRDYRKSGLSILSGGCLWMLWILVTYFIVVLGILVALVAIAKIVGFINGV